jgi:hypothetical protein
MSQFDWPITLKIELWRDQKSGSSIMKHAITNSLALGPHIKMKGGQDLPKHMG